MLRDKMMPAFDPNGTGGSLAVKTEEINNGDAEPAKPAAEPAKPAAEPAKPAAEGENKTEIPAADAALDASWDEPAPYSPKSLSEFLEAKPALKAALESDPEAKATFYATARIAERGAKLEAIVGSPEEAQVYVANGTAFMGVNDKLSAIKDGDNASYLDAVGEMLSHSAVLDEDGNPVKNADGSIRTNGTVGRFLKNAFRVQLDVLYNKAQLAKDDDTMAAIDILMERSGFRPSTGGNEEEMSEELKARVAEVKAGEERLQQERSNQYTRDLEASSTRVDSQTDHTLATAMSTILGKATALDAFSKTNVEREIRVELRKVISGNRAYQAARENIERRPLGPKREAALIKLNADTIREKLRTVAAPILAKAGVSLQTKAQERNDTQAARAAAAQSESRSSLAPASTPAPAAESLEQVTADLRAKNGGREPSTEDILRERMNRRLTPAATR